MSVDELSWNHGYRMIGVLFNEFREVVTSETRTSLRVAFFYSWPTSKLFECSSLVIFFGSDVTSQSSTVTVLLKIVLSLYAVIIIASSFIQKKYTFSIQKKDTYIGVNPGIGDRNPQILGRRWWEV